MADIIQTFPKGTGSGGGHTILDTNGTAVTQEKNLQFTGLSVTDDSTNEKTEVAGEGLNTDSIDDIADASSIVPAVIIGDSNNYSTSEKIVGKWIDGKPIYQKTFTKSNISVAANTSTKVVLGSGATNIELINAFGSANKNVVIPYPWTSIYYTLEIDGDDFCSFIHRNGAATTVSITATFQYTKTTD